MKVSFLLKKILILTLFVAVGNFSKGQNLAGVYNAKEMTWYGVDFSVANFIDFNSEIDTSLLKEYVKYWSFNPLSQQDENQIKKFYNKEILHVDLSVSNRRNENIDYKNRITRKSEPLDINDIRKIISEYEIDGQGFGVLLIVEEILQVPKAYIWVAYINIKEKSLISSRRFVCSDGDGTIKNRWVKAVKRAIEFGGENIKSK